MPRYEDIAGDEENIVGALTQMLRASPPAAQIARRGWAPSNAPSVAAPRFSAAQLATQVGGTQENRLRAPLGLGSFTFNSNAQHNFIVEPQEAFRGERLIVDSALSEDATGLLLIVDEILVGSLPQTPSTEFGLPAVMFRADATDAQMDWQICPAGTKIIVRAHVEGTFGESDTLIASLGIYGVWIRG